MTCSTSWATATLACIYVKISLLKQWPTRYYCYYSMHTGVLTHGSNILKAEYKKHCWSSLFIVLVSSTGNYHHCNSEHIYTAHISFQIMRYSRDCSLVSQLFSLVTGTRSPVVSQLRGATRLGALTALFCLVCLALLATADTDQGLQF